MLAIVVNIKKCKSNAKWTEIYSLHPDFTLTFLKAQIQS